MLFVIPVYIPTVSLKARYTFKQINSALFCRKKMCIYYFLMGAFKALYLWSLECGYNVRLLQSLPPAPCPYWVRKCQWTLSVVITALMFHWKLQATVADRTCSSFTDFYINVCLNEVAMRVKPQTTVLISKVTVAVGEKNPRMLSGRVGLGWWGISAMLHPKWRCNMV